MEQPPPVNADSFRLHVIQQHLGGLEGILSATSVNRPRESHYKVNRLHRVLALVRLYGTIAERRRPLFRVAATKFLERRDNGNVRTETAGSLVMGNHSFCVSVATFASFSNTTPPLIGEALITFPGVACDSAQVLL